jgi:hypothetical protein
VYMCASYINIVLYIIAISFLVLVFSKYKNIKLFQQLDCHQLFSNSNNKFCNFFAFNSEKCAISGPIGMLLNTCELGSNKMVPRSCVNVKKQGNCIVYYWPHLVVAKWALSPEGIRSVVYQWLRELGKIDNGLVDTSESNFHCVKE